jgi:hypothetical protein
VLENYVDFKDTSKRGIKGQKYSKQYFYTPTYQSSAGFQAEANTYSYRQKIAARKTDGLLV